MKANGWQDRLGEEVQRIRLEPHQWGHNDCCTAVADMIFCITGKDHFKLIRGVYADRRTAKQFLTSFGVRHVSSLVYRLANLVFYEQNICEAEEGDLLMVKKDSGWFDAYPAIKIGTNAITKGRVGLSAVSYTQSVISWRV